MEKISKLPGRVKDVPGAEGYCFMQSYWPVVLSGILLLVHGSYRTLVARTAAAELFFYRPHNSRQNLA